MKKAEKQCSTQDTNKDYSCSGRIHAFMRKKKTTNGTQLQSNRKIAKIGVEITIPKSPRNHLNTE